MSTSKWKCPAIRNKWWFILPMIFFVLIDAGFSVLVILELEDTYHQPPVRYSIGFGELWVLMGGIVCWAWAWQKHIIRRERFNLAIEILTGLNEAMLSFVAEAANSGNVKCPRPFSNTEEYIRCNMMAICLTSQLLLWQLVTHGEQPDAIGQILANNPYQYIKTEFDSRYSPKDGQLVSVTILHIVKTWVCNVRAVNGPTHAMLFLSYTNFLDAATLKINMLITNYHRAISRTIDIFFMLFVAIYVVGMPFLLWASEGYWGIGTNVFAFLVVVVPFSYNWFVEDIFQSPTGYYATVIYKCVYRIHASFSKRYAGQTITTELLKEHFGEVLATGT